MRPRIRLLIGDAVALGPGKASLLEAIDDTGSIAAAARSMGMSYGRAWQLVQAMNGDFRAPLIERVAGGRGGGGAALTDLGRDALARYRAMEVQADAAVSDALDQFTELLKNPP
ncbi:putative transcriptional regulator, ModE family protein [alpha proteobacterium BAL199]|jgi:molybdate transport system regulatory protein|nr:putative transcriptional regulator, ModE family protein [alpha proteobacterium BAL199]